MQHVLLRFSSNSLEQVYEVDAIICIFTDEEIEAQKSYEAGPRYSTSKEKERGGRCEAVSPATSLCPHAPLPPHR